MCQFRFREFFSVAVPPSLRDNSPLLGGGRMNTHKRILKTGALAAAMTIVFAIFAFRAAEWTKGLDSEFLVYGAASGGSTGTGGITGGATTKVIAQIAAGFYGDVEPKAYGTVIEIVNPNST